MEDKRPLISFKDADILNGEATVIYGLNLDIYPGDFVVIDVEDTGCGIPQENLAPNVLKVCCKRIAVSFNCSIPFPDFEVSDFFK